MTVAAESSGATPPSGDRSEGPPGVTAPEFRAALGRFATGVTVTTALVDGAPHGMTVNAFTSVSLDPPLVAVCIGRSAVLHAALPDLDAFGISILRASQRDLSVRFADPARPPGMAQFGGVGHHPGPVTGVPLLQGAAATVECVPAGLHPVGDHTIVLGRVVGTVVDPTAPVLTYLDGAYGEAPGRAAAPRGPGGGRTAQ